MSISNISTLLGIISSEIEEKNMETFNLNLQSEDIQNKDDKEDNYNNYTQSEDIQNRDDREDNYNNYTQSEDIQNREDRDNDNDAPNIKEDENIPDIELKSVKELSNVLGNMPYEDVRKGLYKKYGLITKDEESIPGLYMITYNKPDKVSYKNKVELSKQQLDIVSQYRGIVVEKDTNQVVCYTFDKMTRHLPDDIDLSSCRITSSCDGSQIKVYYYNKINNWVISTTRRIDSSKSYFFSNKSFMEMFNESSTNLDWNKLNKDCCYSFVLAHPDNRVVARHNKPFLTHVLTRNMKSYTIDINDIGVPQPSTITFKNKGDVWKSIKNLPYYKEGYVVNYENNFVKLINSKYQDVKDLRGNSNSLLFHYFWLKKQNKIKVFLSYYPESSESFQYFELCFQNLCFIVFNEYILTRVRKVVSPIQILPFLKPVLYKLHGLHLNTKVRIQLHDVRNNLQNYPPYILRKLVDMTNNLSYSFV